MEARVLGPLEVFDPDGARVNLASETQRRLVSVLVARANSVVPGDVLEEHLGLSAGALRTSVSRLRKLIGADALVTAPPGYELRSRSVDAQQFEQLLARARSGDATTARAALTEALALWRGEAYAEFAHEEWARAEVVRLSELRISAVEELAELLMAADEHAAAIALLEPVIDAHRFRDGLRGLLMRALARSGRQTEALRQFQTYRTLLAEEVGTEPSPELAALDLAIAMGDDVAAAARGHRRPAASPHAAKARADGRSLGVFLFTDIVGSTRLWAKHTEAMATDLAQHDLLMTTAIHEHGGASFSTAGDSFAAAFESVDDAVAAAVAAQSALARAGWQLEDGLSVRMAVHVGEAERRGGGWYGRPLNETARMMAAGHGGQILVSATAAARLSDRQLTDLGEHRLRDLDGTHHLFQVDAPTLRAGFPPLHTMGGYTSTLPPQRTSFLGRSQLIGRIHGLVSTGQLVTLVGPGGAGKTRVAIEAAARELPHFADGVFFVDLTQAASDREVVTSFLSGIGLPSVPDEPPEVTIANHLATRASLLVVDNCEHLLDATATLVERLLDAAPELRVLATSREPLGIDGEHCEPVPPLDAEGPTSTAARLFSERAVSADPWLELDAHDLAAIAEIVRRLDGMPLAIELAAARVRSLSPAQMLDHLDERFRLLRTEHRRIAPRQRTLEATIEWSYDLLDDDERRAFRHLAICAGPFTLPIVGGLLDVDELDAADRLDSLVAKSLVTPIRSGGTGRGYRLLESLRAFGLAKLDERDEARSARAGLERALLPPPEHADDWSWLSNDYTSEDGAPDIVEDTTRREAARCAQDEGRLDVAAFIYFSSAFRDDPGSLENLLHVVRPLTERKDELGPMAWRVVNAAELTLARLMRRYGECFDTAERMLADLPPEDPARSWFDAWRIALTTAVAPEVGLALVDDAMSHAIFHARAGCDWSVSSLVMTKATGLALVREVSAARAAAQQALEWCVVGSSTHDQALAVLLWLLVLTGGSPSPRVVEALGQQDQTTGAAQFCAAPAALCQHGSTEERAAELVRLSRLRPVGDVATPYLLAFGWLAVERGELDRARELVRVAELYDSSTAVALIHLLAVLGEWGDADWTAERDAAVAHYLSPEHEPEAEEGPSVLDSELARW